MAFNPSPKVAKARDFANEFQKSHVIIISINDKTREIEYASYGENNQKCFFAKKLADIAYNAIRRYLAE